MDNIKLTQIIQSRCGLRPDTPVLIGVSGGADSLCLLDLLHRLGYALAVAHFDHGLRLESAADAEYVRQQAQQRGLPCIMMRVDVGEFAARQHLSLEDAARRLRYAFLFDQARRVGAQAVAVAHTADDQVETLLLNLLRGAGMAGLKGMRYRTFLSEWDTAIPLVRPLLGVWREEVLAYCDQHQLQPRQDATNDDLTYQRNRVRHVLIPQMQAFNPQVKQALWRTAQALAADHDVLQPVVVAALAGCRRESASGALALDLEALRRLDAGLLRLVLRQALSELRPGERNLGFDEIEQAADFVHAPTRSGSRRLAANLALEIAGGRVVLRAVDAALPVTGWLRLEQAANLPVPGSVELAYGWRLSAEIYPGVPADIPPEDLRAAQHAWLDADVLRMPLRVRARQRGDRFQPFGMEKSILLADFYKNIALPRQARAAHPLVVCGDEVIWVAGVRPAERGRITAATRRMLHLWVEPSG